MLWSRSSLVLLLFLCSIFTTTKCCKSLISTWEKFIVNTSRRGSLLVTGEDKASVESLNLARGQPNHPPVPPHWPCSKAQRPAATDQSPILSPALITAELNQHRQTEKINNSLRLLQKGPLAIYHRSSILSCSDLLVVRQATHGQSTDKFSIMQFSEMHSIRAINNLAHIPASDLY